LWNVDTGQPLHTIAGCVMGVQFTKDGKSVIGGLLNGDRLDFKEWDVTTGSVRATIADTGFVVGMTPDRKTLVTLADQFNDSELRFWDTTTGARRSTIFVKGAVSARMSPDTTQVAVSFWSGIKIWDTATGKQESAYATLSSGRAMAFSPDGKKLA